ncbi:MAG: hypothetical protein KGD66_08640 [Candidatus Lokiarchaeota archaeon]|nr:hypothetical protein [Candidatus Lokiarchaeota archaeon]
MKKNHENWKLHSEYILISSIMILLVISQFQFQPNTNNGISLNTSSEEIVWDSTHIVFSPNDQVFLENLLFQEDWMYVFYLEVVTPHQCEINMTLTDPEGYNYKMFQGTVDQQQKEIQFGMVNEGAYNITLDVNTEFTLNLHLKIERTVSFMDLFDQNEEILAFHGFRFSQNEPLREIPILLDPNSSYTFILALITPLVNILPVINTFIDDPVDNHFIIYQDQALNEFYLTFQFQTINHGIHELQVLIDLLEISLNLMVVVTLDNSNPPISNDPPPRSTLYIPIEVQVVSIGIFIFAILLAVLMKKSSSSRNELSY